MWIVVLFLINQLLKLKNNCHVIVIDHHQGGDKNTKADALVNPNRLDEKSELKFLCAAGVTFSIGSSIK